MEADEEESKSATCPLPCSLASLLSMNCRTRAEGLARRLQAHLKQEGALSLENTYLVRAEQNVRSASTEGRTYSLDDHQLDFFQRTSEMRGLRPIHVVTSEPTLHLSLPPQPPDAVASSKHELEQDSDAYYDFDLVTPPDDYATPGPSGMAATDTIPEGSEKSDKPESGCVTSVTSPILFCDEYPEAPNNPPSPFDDSCPLEALNRRSSEAALEAVREYLASSKINAFCSGSELENKFNIQENPFAAEETEEGEVSYTSSDCGSSDDVDLNLYDNGDSDHQQNSFSHIKYKDTCSVFFSHSSTFQTVPKPDSLDNTSPPPIKFKSPKIQENPNYQFLSFDSESYDRRHESHVANNSKSGQGEANKIFKEVMRSNSLDSGLTMKKSVTRCKMLGSLNKFSKTSTIVSQNVCETFGNVSDKVTKLVHENEIPQLSPEGEKESPNYSAVCPQSFTAEDEIPKKKSLNPFLDLSIGESESLCQNSENYFTKSINSTLVTKPRDRNESLDKYWQENRDGENVASISSFNEEKIVQDIDSIIELLKTDSSPEDKNINKMEDSEKNTCDIHPCAKGLAGEGPEQVVCSYIGSEFSAAVGCQENDFSYEECELCSHQPRFVVDKNVFPDENCDFLQNKSYCSTFNDSYYLTSEVNLTDIEMPIAGGQTKGKRAQPSANLGTEKLPEATGSSFSSPFLSEGAEVTDELVQINSVSVSDSHQHPVSVFKELKVRSSDKRSETLAQNNEESPCINNRAHDLSSSLSSSDTNQNSPSYTVDENCCNSIEQCNSLQDNQTHYLSSLEDSKHCGHRNSYGELIEPTAAVVQCDEGHNCNPYYAATIQCSTNPFLNDISNSVPSNTFHIYNENNASHSTEVLNTVNNDNFDFFCDKEIALSSVSGQEPTLSQVPDTNKNAEGTASEIVLPEVTGPVDEAEYKVVESNDSDKKEILSDESLDLKCTGCLSQEFTEIYFEDSNVTYRTSRQSDMLSDNCISETDNTCASNSNEHFRNGAGPDPNIVVAIEEPGAICLIQRGFADEAYKETGGESKQISTANDEGSSLSDNHDSTVDETNIEMDNSEPGVTDEDQMKRDVSQMDEIETLPVDESKDDEEEEESDEEVIISGKFRNLSGYSEKVLKHSDEDDGCGPLPPTEVILVDLDEPIEPPKEEESETAEEGQQEIRGSDLASELSKLQMEEPSIYPPSDDSNRSSEEREVGGDMQMRIKRSSSLRCGKTPPGTPGRKKIVRFADALGLDLADIRTYLDGIPNVPQSAFCDLQVEEDSQDPHHQQGHPSFASYSAAASAAAAALQHQARRLLTPMFQQPGALPDFYDRLRQQKVVLENVSIGADLSVKGVVRVVNEDFRKRVIIRYTFDHWKNNHEATATYVDGSSDGFSDRFSFLLWGSFLQSNGALIFCVKYSVKGNDYWDNNRGWNYVLQCYSAPPLPVAEGEPRRLDHLHQNSGNSEHNSSVLHQDHEHEGFKHAQQYSSFMDTPTTPSDPWIPRFF